MSRSVYLVCTECRSADGFDVCSDSINRGEDRLREMWATREVLAKLVAMNVWEIRAEYGYGDWPYWIAAHVDHKVILRDEYGGEAPVDGDGACVRKEEP